MSDAAVRYARALVSAAENEGSLPEIAQEISFLSGVFSGKAAEFSSPVFPVREQLKTIELVLGDSFAPLTKRFLRLLASHRRLGEIERISKEIKRQAAKAMGQVSLELTVYAGLPPDETERLVLAAGQKGLFDHTDRGNISVNLDVDKSLLGGFIAECDGLCWDCSLQARVNEMKKLIFKA